MLNNSLFFYENSTPIQNLSTLDLNMAFTAHIDLFLT